MARAPHSAAEDVQGVAFGALMAAVGTTFLTTLGLVTGQTAGIALLIAYAFGWQFGPVFAVINLPFYVLGLRRFGRVFVLKTFVAVGALSLLTTLVPGWLNLSAVDPLFGAVFAGLCQGTALLALFRHGASLGGIGILALAVERRFGLRAGLFQLGVDALIFAAALALLPPWKVALSAIGAAVMNLVLAINHRRERYLA